MSSQDHHGNQDPVSNINCMHIPTLHRSCLGHGVGLDGPAVLPLPAQCSVASSCSSRQRTPHQTTKNPSSRCTPDLIGMKPLLGVSLRAVSVT